MLEITPLLPDESPFDDPTRLAPAFFEITVPKDLTKIKTSIIRITLDTKAVAGWNEIDAVQLIGLP